MRRIVVIGGVAAVMNAASQAKRRRSEAQVAVLERVPVFDPIPIAASLGRKRLQPHREEAALAGRGAP